MMASTNQNGVSKARQPISNGAKKGGKALTNGRAVVASPPAPEETDLDYISRPENYGGSNLQSLQRFFLAREKQQKSQQQSNKKKRIRREEDDLFRRYRHILRRDGSHHSDSGDDDDDDDDDNDDRGNDNNNNNDKKRELRVSNAGGDDSARKEKSSQHRAVPLTAPEAVPRMQGGDSDVRPTTDGNHTSSGGEDMAGEMVRKVSKGSPPDGLLPGSDFATSIHTADPSTKSDSSLTLTLTSSSATLGGQGEGEGSLCSSGRKGFPRGGVKNRFAHLTADVKSKQIRRKFSQAIKAVMSIRRLAAIMIKKSEEPSAMLQTFTDGLDNSANFSENLRNQGLSFDPSYFRANKEISISSEVKHILNMPPACRTQEQIQTAMYGLQSLPSFAEYPLHMQEKLTKVAWYEKVSPKRTIIRQGHYAENFYFILSGQAVVTLTMYDPKTNEPLPRTANFMRKGTSFGELALLHHSRRTATVTSHDTVQLLSIGREDFFDIFMSRQGPDQIPDHIRFISQLDFMKGWPIERLLDHPEHCLLHFFKRNMVIVNNSKESEWLYIVKSGSCQVLKQLRGVTAKLGIRKHEATLDERFHLPHTGTSVRGPKIDTGLFRPRPRSLRSLAESTEESEEDQSTPRNVGGRRKGTVKAPPPSSLLIASSTPNGSSSFPSSSSTITTISSRPPAASQHSNNSKSSNKFSKETYSGTTKKAHFTAKALPSLRLKGPLKPRPSSLSPESTPRSSASSIPPPPVFVQVSHLKPRDVFGLEFIRFIDDLDVTQTSVSLVSRGAECIMLSKEFFCRHANEMVRKNLQELVRPFPDELTFQESLQRKADWDLFKHTLIEDITSVMPTVPPAPAPTSTSTTTST